MTVNPTRGEGLQIDEGIQQGGVTQVAVQEVIQAPHPPQEGTQSQLGRYCTIPGTNTSSFWLTAATGEGV